MNRTVPRSACPNWWSNLLTTVLACLWLIGCSGKDPAVPGEVLMLITSDMQVPGSIDTLVLEVDQDAKYIYNAPPATRDPSAVIDPDSSCTTGTVRNERLAFPTTIALLSDSDRPKPVQVTLRACHAGHQVFERKFTVLIPESGQVRMLRAPIRWLCSDWNHRCFGCDHSDTNATDNGGDASSGENMVGAATSCSHRQLSLLATPDSCQPPACLVDSSEQFTVIDYIADEVVNYVAERPADSPCLSPVRCFEMGTHTQFGTHNWKPLATGRVLTGTKVDQTACVATLETSQTAPEQFNVALVLPAGERGFCDGFRCLIQLDANGVVGWKWTDPSHLKVELPMAVCHLLETGQILYVAGTGACPSKPSTLPLCERPDPTPESNNEAQPRPWTHWTFDDGCLPPSRPDIGEVPQTRFNCVDRLTGLRPDTDGAAYAGMTSEIAVKRRAGRLNSKQYLRASNSIELAESGLLSVWVSLANPPPSDSSHVRDVTTALMPVFSNIPSNCASGMRLELRTCHENSDVIVALGVPTGAKDLDTCLLSYVYARLARRSDTGGSFTPWQVGNWYHISVVRSDPNHAQIYVDGADANASPIDAICGLPPSAWQPDDGSLAYVGTEGSIIAIDEQAPNGASVSHSSDLLIDELEFYDAGLSVDQIRTIMLQSSTWLGASGFRWGTWGTQGSTSQHDWDESTTRFTVKDAIYSSAGGFAWLADEGSATHGPTSKPAEDISGFDEAVLVAELPKNSLFQFAMVSDHGQRQCTWQLASGAMSGPLPYVIDLTRPSWCVDPACGFDTSAVERVSIGSDWTTAQQPFNYSIVALAFRRRTAAPNVATTNAPLQRKTGGLIGPDGMCWRAITYDFRYVVEPLSVMPALSPKATAGAVSMSAPIEYPGYAELLSDLQQPELAADFMDPYGTRDFTTCTKVRMCLALSSKAPSNIGAELVLQNEFGYTMTWPISSASTAIDDCYRWVDLSKMGTPWPKELPLEAAKAIQSSVTRFAIRYPGVVVQSAECCNSDASDCIEIGKMPGKATAL